MGPGARISGLAGAGWCPACPGGERALVVDVPEVAAEPESLGADLASRVIEIRGAYYARRETAAGARRKLDADIAAAKIAIEQDDRGFHPDSSFLRRMTETWNKYGQLGKLSARPVLPQSLDQAGELWSACAQCCAQELRDYQNDHGNWEQRRRGVFGNRPDEPRLSSRF